MGRKKPDDSGIETLSGVDGALLNLETAATPMHVGLRMTGYWPLSIVEHGVGLNVTVMSYAGVLCLGFVVARCAVPDARQLADDSLDAFAEFRKRMQKSPGAPRKAAAAKPARTRKVIRARRTAAAK